MRTTQEEVMKTLGGNSPIQVRFVGWLVLVCASGFGGWIWWAASMSTKLDVVINNQSAQMAATRAVVEDVSRLKEWRIQIDTVGSPSVVHRLEEIEKMLRDLKNQFDLHRVGQP